MSKFDFYEVVKIVSVRESSQEINGLEAIVLGMSENDSGDWGYSVKITTSDDTWYLLESELTPTGKILNREEIYDGSSVKVSVDLDTGEGSLID